MQTFSDSSFSTDSVQALRQCGFADRDALVTTRC